MKGKLITQGVRGFLNELTCMSDKLVLVLMLTSGPPLLQLIIQHTRDVAVY